MRASGRATGVRDPAGNQASFAATGVDDLAGPVLMTATSTAGTTANRMQAGDTFVLTFSEPLAATSLANNSSATSSTITTTGSGVGTGSGGASISPSSVLTDLAGNSARTTARTMSPLF